MPETVRVGVFGSGGAKKATVRSGDVVTLRNVRDALRLPAPTVTELLPERRLLVTYWVRNSDGSHRQKRVEVSARDVETAEPTFSIGNVVRVTKAVSPILVDVGTEGKLLGGDGRTWVVAFRVDRVKGAPLGSVLNVTHEGVPGTALELVKEEESEYDEEESEYESSEGEEEEKVAPLPAVPARTVVPKDTDSSLWNTTPVTSVLAASKAPSRKESSVLSHGNSVVGCTAVSSVLSSALSEFANLSREHVAALKAAGATNAQLCIMDTNEAVFRLTPGRAVAAYKKGL